MKTIVIYTAIQASSPADLSDFELAGKFVAKCLLDTANGEASVLRVAGAFVNLTLLAQVKCPEGCRRLG